MTCQLHCVLYLTASILVSSHPLVLLVIYDGFRYDYLQMIHHHHYNTTPTFNMLINSGVYAHHVHNIFPTVTMPTHMTILSGVYPETHGIVANNFYDSHLNLWYHLENGTDRLQILFDNGQETVWVTNQKSAYDRFSGSTLFPCTLTSINGYNVTHQLAGELYNESITYEMRVDALISWFTHRTHPINLGLFYYEEPDLACHMYGPESLEMFDTIIDLDRKTEYLIQKLEEHNLWKDINVIFTSDHGGTYVSSNKLVYLEDYIHVTEYTHVSLGAFGLIMPNKGLERSVFQRLKKMERNHPQVRVYWKNDTVIKNHHYSTNVRIPLIIILMDLGWSLVDQRSYAFNSVGSHGFGPSYPDMRPYFIAHGPAFKVGYNTSIIHQIDLYELMCSLLDVNPAPNNGSLDRIKHILVSSTLASRLSDVFTFSICSLIAIVFSIFAVLSYSHRKGINRHNPDCESRLLSDTDATNSDTDL